ncbi:MAG TPA: hypothetical protein VGS19_32615 [Streptosporangiaceae bacterium]|nr:hypothetical protein [Streptosporangiaceae bacterium]
MKRYKYQAMVSLVLDADTPGATLPGPMCRVVVRAENPETRVSRLFSALLTSSDDSPFKDPAHSMVTLVVLGDDCDDCLAHGEQFTLWRDGEIGHGVVTRKVFV